MVIKKNQSGEEPSHIDEIVATYVQLMRLYNIFRPKLKALLKFYF